ncbi:hypothetical protein AGMMS49574_03830 [Bacteroidia bacterium]|nr:hypothetical protein AGMMS49574_03830 [Bacteroidia bacterium]
MRRILIFVLYALFALSVLSQNAVWVIKPVYEEISTFSEGVAAVKQNGKWGYFTSNGNKILELEYDMAFPFSEGIGVLTNSGNRLAAIVDKAGNKIVFGDSLTIDRRFALFSDGLLLVAGKNGWGYMDKTGKIQIPCKYKYANPFSDGLAAVCLELRYWYYIDTDGNPSIGPWNKKQTNRWASGFNGGKALVLFDNQTKLINREGKVLKEKIPNIISLPDEIIYKQKNIRCKDGTLIFDQKSRIIAFISNGNDTIRFMPEQENPVISPANTPFIPIMLDGQVLTAEDERVTWTDHLTAIIRRSGSYGTIAFREGSDFIIETEDGIASSKRQATAKCSIRNISNTTMYENLEVRINGKILSDLRQMAPNSERTFTVDFDGETEKGTLHTFISEYGLQMEDDLKNISIHDIPYIKISIDEDNAILAAGQTVYPIHLSVTNTTSTRITGITVSANDSEEKSRKIDIMAGSTVKMQFTIPAMTTHISVTASHPDFWDINEYKSITIKKTSETTITKPQMDRENIIFKRF